MVTPDTSILSARAYGLAIGDYQTVSSWWEARHGRPFPENRVPPLGVIVNRGSESVAALWAYQPVGIGVAFLEYAVTRPGLSMAQAHAALGFALLAVSLILEKDGYSLARCFVDEPAMIRAMKRHGFFGKGGNLVKIL